MLSYSFRHVKRAIYEFLVNICALLVQFFAIERPFLWRSSFELKANNGLDTLVSLNTVINKLLGGEISWARVVLKLSPIKV